MKLKLLGGGRHDQNLVTSHDIYHNIVIFALNKVFMI